MKLTISVGEELHNLEVHGSMDIQSFKALLGAELDQPEERILILYNNKELAEPTKSLDDYGVQENDILVANILSLEANPQTQLPQSSFNNSTSFGTNPEALRQKILTIPQLKRRLEETSPELAEAAVNDPAKFARLFIEFERKQREMEFEREKEMALLEADPFNIEAQKKIEEIIRNQNVMENMKEAMEHNPESFGQVHMLYIDIEVNGVRVKAFVDSGAQSTIISPSCAEKCGLMRLLDTRFQGIARGVGTAKILGRVHNAPIKIGANFYPCSFMVLEGKDVDLLFGLDMLKRYQACIDLKLNALVINDEKIPFLPEHQIPKSNFQGDPNEQNSVSSSTPSNQAMSSSNTLSQGTNSQVSEKAIKDLMELGGITREYAVALLTQTNGDADLAANILLG